MTNSQDSAVSNLRDVEAQSVDPNFWACNVYSTGILLSLA
jgi:hypothetical protein